MPDLELVNFFNALYVSSCRVVRLNENYRVYQRNVASTFILPMLISIATAYCGVMTIIQKLKFLQSIGQLSSVARYANVTLAVHILSTWCLLQHRKVVNLLDALISFDRLYCRAYNIWKPAVKLRLVKAGITFVCITYIFMIGIRVVMCIIYYRAFGPYNTIFLIGVGLSELFFYLNQLFVEFFVEHFTIRYQLLRKQLRSNLYSLVRSMKLYDLLSSMKLIFANAFAVQFLLSTLMTFLDCAIITYHTLQMMNSTALMANVIIESFYVVPRVLLFFEFLYQFERLNHVEQEFKNAIKSLQYEATEEHSEDYLNFLDLINLKLMTESPKITACGLFTVNLQVFYNVFAAIVTYIMILFQFRDFEK